jgi:hypothetical protein
MKRPRFVYLQAFQSGAIGAFDCKWIEVNGDAPKTESRNSVIKPYCPPFGSWPKKSRNVGKKKEGVAPSLMFMAIARSWRQAH